MLLAKSRDRMDHPCTITHKDDRIWVHFRLIFSAFVVWGIAGVLRLDSNSDLHGWWALLQCCTIEVMESALGMTPSIKLTAYKLHFYVLLFSLLIFLDKSALLAKEWQILWPQYFGSKRGAKNGNKSNRRGRKTDDVSSVCGMTPSNRLSCASVHQWGHQECSTGVNPWGSE